MSNFTGPLNLKRRSSLVSIHAALDLPTQPGRATKHDLAERIRAELKTNKLAREDERFSDLWEHMPESRMDPEQLERALAAGEAVDLTPAQEGRVREGSVGSVGSASGSSPRKSLDQLYHHQLSESPATTNGAEDGAAAEGLVPSTYREALLAGPEHILDSLFSPTRLSHGQAHDGLALVPASRATRSLRRKASLRFQESVKGGATVLGTAQDKASEPWVLVAGVVLAELIWVVWEAIPWVEKTFGPHPSLLLPFHPTTLYYSLPVLSVLFHPTFLSALSLWVLSTLCLPLFLSTLLSSSSRRHSHSSGPAPPDPLIFTLTRCALALLRGFVFPPSPFSPLTNLGAVLREVVAGGPGALGLAGGRVRFEEAVEGYWGVMGVGMAATAAILAVGRK
ncbi:hypothetical protein JCM11641_001985 [Rhodosporidiobolus odoratus]